MQSSSWTSSWLLPNNQRYLRKLARGNQPRWMVCDDHPVHHGMEEAIWPVDGRASEIFCILRKEKKAHKSAVVYWMASCARASALTSAARRQAICSAISPLLQPTSLT